MDLGTFSSPGKRKRKATLSRHLHAHREGGSTKVTIYTESLLTPINIWILIPITIWNTNDRWWELSFFEPRRSSRTIDRGCLASRQRQPTPQVQKVKSSPFVLTVSHFPIPARGFRKLAHKSFQKQGVGTFHKPFKTIRQHLIHPKDPTHNERKWGVVYEIQCEG